MLTMQDIQGKTLAELRAINRQLDLEQANENEALRTAYLSLQSAYRQEREDIDLQLDEEHDRIQYEFHTDQDNLEMEYKELGTAIGSLMDIRRNITDESEQRKIAEQISSLMDARTENKKKRRERASRFRHDLLEFKRGCITRRRTLGCNLQNAEHELRRQRMAVKQRYADLRDVVRKEIAKRLAEERAETD